MSATAACATEWLVPDAPSITRAANSTHNTSASPVNSDPIVDPTNAKISTGRRPIRSDKRPHSGAATNCAAENAATIIAAVAGPASKRSAYTGRIGNTIPNPTRSSATAPHNAANPGGNGGFAVGVDESAA